MWDKCVTDSPARAISLPEAPACTWLAYEGCLARVLGGAACLAEHASALCCMLLQRGLMSW